MTDAFLAARTTLDRAAAFLADGFRLPPRDTLGRGTARVLANSLRELDRFLNLLIDEAAIGHGMTARPRQHNTANKLRQFRAALDQPSEADDRLRAMGRTRECLFYCGGVIPRGDKIGMTLGWRASKSDPTLAFSRAGETMRITADTLADIGQFYTDLAAGLPAGHGDQPTISSGLKK